jgi:hypothetical protein
MFLIYRFQDGEYEAFRQIVVFAVKKKEPEMDEKMYEELASIPSTELQELPFAEEPSYCLPRARAVKLFRSMRVDIEMLENEVKDSPLWNRFKELTRFEQGEMERPPLPLHTGHLGLLLASGLLRALGRP